MQGKVRENDTILLPDNSEGKVIEVVKTESIMVYKVNMGEYIGYLDESKVRLKKRHIFNLFYNFIGSQAVMKLPPQDGY